LDLPLYTVRLMYAFQFAKCTPVRAFPVPNTIELLYHAVQIKV